MYLLWLSNSLLESQGGQLQQNHNEKDKLLQQTTTIPSVKKPNTSESRISSSTFMPR